ncbi:hypothetical protein CEXT_217641 [Caerostris extrusa]|uniref:Uncharacterized protein n=1 Tax=Caerostris extrusa TaxID=172846 RepID=A0AAV4S9D4_CAEEX|nr:hypothetical protein CEXT_217641 [Caerostris extrusa]
MPGIRKLMQARFNGRFGEGRPTSRPKMFTLRLDGGEKEEKKKSYPISHHFYVTNVTSKTAFGTKNRADARISEPTDVTLKIISDKNYIQHECMMRRAQCLSKGSHNPHSDFHCRPEGALHPWSGWRMGVFWGFRQVTPSKGSVLTRRRWITRRPI